MKILADFEIQEHEKLMVALGLDKTVSDQDEHIDYLNGRNFGHKDGDYMFITSTERVIDNALLARMIQKDNIEEGSL